MRGAMERRLKPALKLVDTRELAREEWLQVRKSGIGSSDAAAAVGLNPYKSQLELWLEKTGQDQHLAKPDPNDEDSPTYWGTLLEPIVAAHYTRQTGRRLRRINAVLQHSRHPWMLANIDREILGDEQVQILECKTAGFNGSMLWKEGVPEYVQLQVMHQLAVTGKRAADVAVLLCGHELQIHRIERDETMIADLITLEEAFWRLVERREAPKADGSESADRALRCLFREDNGATLDFTRDREMSGVFCDLWAVRRVLAEHTELEAQLKQRIQQAMGEASRARFEAGEVSWKRSKDRTGLDVDRLLNEAPDLANRFAVPVPGSRRFLINKP